MLAKAGKLNAALADLDRAIALRPDDASAWRNRGLAWSRTSDVARADRGYAEAKALAAGR